MTRLYLAAYHLAVWHITETSFVGSGADLRGAARFLLYDSRLKGGNYCRARGDDYRGSSQSEDGRATIGSVAEPRGGADPDFWGT